MWNFKGLTPHQPCALIACKMLQSLKNLCSRGNWTSLGLGLLLLMSGCGQISIDPPGTKEKLIKENSACILPFQNPSKHTVDRTLGFMACFETQPDLKNAHTILSTWSERLGKETLDSFLTPVEALVTDPPFFRYVLSLMKDPEFPQKMAPFIESVEYFLNSPIGVWGLEFLQNIITEFEGDLNNILQKDLQDPGQRAIWISTAYMVAVSMALAIKTYEEPSEEIASLWDGMRRSFMLRAMGEMDNPKVHDWIKRKHRTYIDYFWTQGPEYLVMDLLLDKFPDGLINTYSENVWLLKRAGDSGVLEQQHFTDYINVHMNVMFGMEWPIDETKLILSRSSPITFQLFQINTPDMIEVEYSRWLNRNLMTFESTGALYQFVQFVQILFDLDIDVFWSLMEWMCDAKEGADCNFFQSVSYLWTWTPGIHAVRNMSVIPNFAKQKLYDAERDENFKDRVVNVFPKVEEHEAWVDGAIELIDTVMPVLMEWGEALAEGRSGVPEKILPKIDEAFLTKADQFVSHISKTPNIEKLLGSLQSIMAQPEFVALLEHFSHFLLSESAIPIMNQTAVMGERFLADIPTWNHETATPFSIKDSQPVDRKPLLDWYEIVPPTPAQEWEIEVILDALDHPSAEVSSEWSKMGGINTLYYMFMPDYLIRENFDSIHALLWISSLSEEFDYPATFEVQPLKNIDEMIPEEVNFGKEFIGPHWKDPTRRLLWRMSQTRNTTVNGKPVKESLAQVLVGRLQERILNVPDLDGVLMRMASEQSYMHLHSDREIPAMKRMITELDSRLVCGTENDDPLCGASHMLKAYLDVWDVAEKKAQQPYDLTVERSGWGDPSIFEEMEDIMLTSRHPFNFDLHRTLTIDNFVTSAKPNPVAPQPLSQEGERLGMMMRILGLNGIYHDDMAMHFFINLVNNSDGKWPRIHELVNSIFFDEFTGSGKLSLDKFVDIKGQFLTSLFEGIYFPSGRVYCFENNLCGFPTQLAVISTLSQFSTFRYLAEPLGNRESIFSLFAPFFRDVATFTPKADQLNHAWGKNHLAFFIDMARTHGFRATRPFILHLSETGELGHALKLLATYLGTYKTHDDFKYLNMTLSLLDEKLPLFERLLDKLPNLEGINPIYVFDGIWVGLQAALEKAEGFDPPRAPDIDQWIAAVLSVLDEDMIDKVAEFASVIEEPARALLGSARYLRLLGDQYDALKLLTKIFFNISVTEHLKKQMTFEERQDLIRDTIAELPKWTKDTKKLISEQSWARVTHEDPVRDAQWLEMRTARLNTYLEGLFFPRGKPDEK
jgi:hypothetical protein